jgi:hypothetical protein
MTVFKMLTMCALWNITKAEEVEIKLKVTSLGSINEFDTPNIKKRFTLIGAISSPPFGSAFE